MSILMKDGVVYFVGWDPVQAGVRVKRVLCFLAMNTSSEFWRDETGITRGLDCENEITKTCRLHGAEGTVCIIHIFRQNTYVRGILTHPPNLNESKGRARFLGFQS